MQLNQLQQLFCTARCLDPASQLSSGVTWWMSSNCCLQTSGGQVPPPRSGWMKAPVVCCCCGSCCYCCCWRWLRLMDRCLRGCGCFNLCGVLNPVYGC